MAATAGKGTIFQRWNGSTWVNISQIKNISGPSASRETIDVTTLDSTGGYREFIGGFRDGGDVSMSMIFDASTYALMKADFESEALQSYRIILSDTDNTTFDFDGFVTELPLDIPPDDVISCDVSIKVSGQTDTASLDTVASVATISDLNVALNTQLADTGLPATVTVTWDDGTSSAVAVVWNAGTPMYDGGVGGAYVFVGTLTMATGKANPSGLTATVTVNVASA